MPRCKNQKCRLKFTAKYFLQKFCCDECSDLCAEAPTTINQKSEKQKERETIYTPLRKAYLLKHPHCEVCGMEATEIHHKNGRNGDRLNDTEFYLSVCRGCHNYIHKHPAESREQGYLV